MNIHETQNEGDVIFSINKVPPDCICFECVDSECKMKFVSCPGISDPCWCENIGFLSNNDCSTNAECSDAGPSFCGGCCCLDGSPDPTKTTRSTCESAGGTWKAGEPCEQTDCCNTECWGACVTPEHILQCYERVDGQLQEGSCPPCGDECYYNMNSTSPSPGSPSTSYICLTTKTKEACESIPGVGGQPSVWLGCGSLQRQCYYNKCNDLWFPLPGSSKGNAYSFCASPVADNCASDRCVEGCGSPCCCYHCVRNGEVDCQYGNKETCEDCGQVHSCVETLQTLCGGGCPEGSTPSSGTPSLEVFGDNNAYATGSLTVGCGAILSAEVTYSANTFASFAKIEPTLTIPGNATGTVSTQPIGDGTYAVSAVTVTSGGSGYTEGAPLYFNKAADDVIVANATAIARVAFVEPQNAAVEVFSAGGSGALLELVWQLTDTPSWISPNIRVYKLAGVNVLDGGAGYADYDLIFISFPSTQDGYVYEIAYIDTNIVGAGGVIQQVYVAEQSDIFTPVPGGLYRGSPTDALESVSLDQGGSYYGVDESAPPVVSGATVAVANGGGGSGANITANIDADAASPTFGKVTSFTVNSGGGGYVSLCERTRPVDSCNECPALQSPESATCQTTIFNDGSKPCGTWTGGFSCNENPCN